MRIKELIDYLKEFDENLEIVIANTDGYGENYLPIDKPSLNEENNKVVI